MKILRKMEHDIDFIVFDMSPEIGIGEIRRRLGKVLERSPVSLARNLSAVKKAMNIQYLCERLDRAAYLKAGYEARKADKRL